MQKNLDIVLKVVGTCNKSCGFCYATKQHNALDVKDILNLLTKLEPEYNKFTIVLMGGEPLLWGLDNLQKLLDGITNITTPVEVKLITNGMLLYNKHISELLNNYKVSILISLNTLNDCKRLDYLDKHLNNYMISTVMSHSNIRDIIKIGESVNAYTNQWSLIPVHYYSNEDSTELLTVTDIDIHYREYVRHYKNSTTVDGYLDTLANLITKPSATLLCSAQGNCFGHRITVYPDGEIYMCDIPVDMMRLGTLNDSNLKLTIDDNFFKKWDELASAFRERNCKNCSELKLCKGGCPQLHMLSDSTYNHSNKYQCELFKHLITIIREEFYK